MFNFFEKKASQADRHVDSKGRVFTGPRALYDMLYADAPKEGPFGAESMEWLAATLARFGTERLDAAVQVAREHKPEDLATSQALKDFLTSLWDSVSRELDCTSLPPDQVEVLKKLETDLAHSVHVLRPLCE